MRNGDKGPIWATGKPSAIDFCCALKMKKASNMRHEGGNLVEKFESTANDDIELTTRASFPCFNLSIV